MYLRELGKICTEFLVIISEHQDTQEQQQQPQRNSEKVYHLGYTSSLMNH